jgi:hypothetical protein
VKANACSSIRDKIEFDSNETDESELHPRKQSTHKTSSDAGITISTNPLSENAFSAIRDNLEPDSNLTMKRDLHSEKALHVKVQSMLEILKMSILS